MKLFIIVDTKTGQQVGKDFINKQNAKQVRNSLNDEHYGEISDELRASGNYRYQIRKGPEHRRYAA